MLEFGSGLKFGRRLWYALGKKRRLRVFGGDGSGYGVGGGIGIKGPPPTPTPPHAHHPPPPPLASREQLGEQSGKGEIPREPDLSGKLHAKLPVKLATDAGEIGGFGFSHIPVTESGTR